MSDKLKPAEFQRLGNDLYWDFCRLIYQPENEQEKIHFCHVKWIGYDDNYWWNNVSLKEKEGICPKCGRKYAIDFKTNKVIEILKGETK